MTDDASGQAAAALCAAHGVQLGEVFPSHYGLVARVRDEAGRDLLLKASQPEQHDCLDEGAAWAAWRGRPCVPQLVSRFDDGCHLREFVDGATIDRGEDGGIGQTRAGGELLALLHAPVDPAIRAAAPSGWLDIESAKLLSSRYLDDTARGHARRCVDEIAGVTERVLIHGDFYPRNILLTARGLVALDPLARLDAAAADMASFALTTRGDVTSALAALTAGYGGEPPALEAYADLWAIRNLHYRGAFEAAARAGAQGAWQPCYVRDGDGYTWQE